MPKPQKNYKITISEKDALAGLLKVKPTPGMPRPGAQAQKAKKRIATKKG